MDVHRPSHDDKPVESLHLGERIPQMEPRRGDAVAMTESPGRNAAWAFEIHVLKNVKIHLRSCLGELLENSLEPLLVLFGKLIQRSPQSARIHA